MKYAVITFGCRVNQADSLGFEEQLRAAGAIAVPPEAADLVLVNTCSVTATADQGARQIIRRVARDNPDARIVVTGCYATRRPDEVAALPNVARVVPNDDKPRLIPILRSTPTTSERFGDGDGSCGAAVEPGVAGRTAFTLRVQTGCAEPCSYCIIPTTRGTPRSVPVDDVLREVDRVAAAGFKEIALTGVHLGSYGRDLQPRASLIGLLRALADADIPGVHLHPALDIGRVRFEPDLDVGSVRLERDRDIGSVRFERDRDIGSVRLQPDLDVGGVRFPRGRARGKQPDLLFRISSLEPMDCSREIVELVATSERFAPHFHLPLQHASNRVLAAMRRPYTIEYYASLVDRIRSWIPHASIGSDIIVGFPGEANDDFEQLARYLERSPLTHLHVFPYSDRPGTSASTMREKVGGVDVRERARRVRAIGQRLASQFLESQIGTLRPGLTVEDGSLVVTDNYLKMRIAPGRGRNERVMVTIAAPRNGAGTADCDAEAAASAASGWRLEPAP